MTTTPSENGHAIEVLSARLTTERELREAFEKQMEERDRRYQEKFVAQQTAIAAALAAQEKLTAAAFAASDKAINKAEDAQRDYNVRSNEFRGQLDDQAKTLLPRFEANSRFDALLQTIDELKEAISDLREFRGATGGHQEQQVQARGSNQWVIGVVLSAILGIAGLAVSIIVLVMSRKP